MKKEDMVFNAEPKDITIKFRFNGWVEQTISHTTDLTDEEFIIGLESGDIVTGLQHNSGGGARVWFVADDGSEIMGEVVNQDHYFGDDDVEVMFDYEFITPDSEDGTNVQ